MKIFGWVLLVVGIICAVGAYSYNYGAAGVVTMLVVAAIGVWLAFKKEGSNPPMNPPVNPTM